MTQLPVVCIQGLGFVGAAMATATANATSDGKPLWHVIGVDLPTPAGHKRIAAINAGEFPFPTNDKKLGPALQACRARGNLEATTDPEAFAKADIIVVDVNLDVEAGGQGPTAALGMFRRAIATVGQFVKPDALIIVETTVPPGTTERVALPALREGLAARNLPTDQIRVAHAYERVMPGDQYLDSIVNFWRVYAGIDERSADACEAFLRTVVNVKDYPLTRLSSVTASETAKVLENSYRAATIAFMEEWGVFAETVGVDMFEIVQAIRVRPTHSNIRTPGFGVGGYCLTKDPLFAQIGARELFGAEVAFPFCTSVVRTNADSPLHTVALVRDALGGLAGKTILLCGIGYRPDVGDTRYSPSEPFVRTCEAEGATVVLHDPLVGHWDELDRPVSAAIPPSAGIDAVVLAVGHREYRGWDLAEWLSGRKAVVVDANGVLDKARRAGLRAVGARVLSVGRGEAA